MQTGYNNFWMYQNNRHEHVHNLPKNDNYIYVGLTDNYKQMQNGGYPSNTIVTPYNSVARPQNNHHSTAPHYMWPSSVYSMPFNSSFSNNFHSQMFPNEANNFNYSSQYSQSRTDMRNYNVNLSQKSRIINDKQVINRPTLTTVNNNINNNNNNNSSSSSSSCNNNNNNNINDTERARIRVRDVSALNSNSIYNSVSDNNLVQSQKNKQYEYPMNYIPNNSNRTCDFETSVPVTQHLPSSYVQADQQQFLQCSGAPYQQNDQISSGSQIQSNTCSQRGSNLQSEHHKTKSSFLSRLLRNNRNVEENQNNLCNSLDVNRTATLKPNATNHLNCFNSVNSHNTGERTNNIINHDSSQINKNSTCESSYASGFSFVQNQNQVNFTNIDQASSFNQNPSFEDSRKRQISERMVSSNPKTFSKNMIHNQGNNLKNTVSHTSQTTYINAVEPNNNEKNSSLSLPTLLESNSEMYHGASNKNNTQNYIQSNGNPLSENSLVRRQSCNTSPARNAYNISPRPLSNDCNPTAQNSNCDFYNDTGNTSGNYSTNVRDGNEVNNEFIETSSEVESISNDETFLSDVSVKQEISTSEVNSPSVQLDHNIAVDYVMEEIKTEECQLEQEQPQSSENSPCILLNSDGRSLDFNKEKKHGVVSETFVHNSKVSTDCGSTRNCISEFEVSGKTISKEDKNEKNIGNHEASLKKIKLCVEEGKYVSKINRDKLDLLIRFLRKEDENVKTKKLEENHQEVSAKKITEEAEIKKEVSLSCSRRKLSKTLIVKNKNNSREMVSLVTTKTFRGESQNSPKTPPTPHTPLTPQIVEICDSPNKEEKEEERKTSFSDEVKVYEKRADISEKEINTLEEKEKQKKSIGIQTQESGIDEEKNILQIMQVLQNLKSHFCLGCTLVSPIDSFWINVVSGELRCLNCFRKMTLKADENIIKFKKACSNDGNISEVTYFLEDNLQKKNECNKENKLEVFCNKCKSECNSEKSFKEPKVNVKQETVSSVNEETNNTGNEEGNITPKCTSTEMNDAAQTSDAFKKKSVEEQKKLKLEESQCKSEKNQNLEEKALSINSRKKSSSVENQGVENTSAVNHSKQLSDSHGKKNSLREDNQSPNSKSFCDNLKKEKKPSDQLGGKSKECKTILSKEGVEKEIKDDSEKSVKKNFFKDEDVSENGKKDKKQFKDSSHSKKRANSKEEIGSHKVRILEEEAMNASNIKSPPKESSDSHKLHSPEGNLKKGTNESSDKSRIQSFSNDSSIEQKAKTSSKHVKLKNENSLEDSDRKISNSKNLEKEKSTGSNEQSRKRKTSMEEIIPKKIRYKEEHSKISKQLYVKTKIISKADDVGKNKTTEHSKSFAADLTSASRKKSKDECLFSKEQSKTEVKNFKESLDKTRRNSTSKENFGSSEQKKESSVSENKEKKNCLGKVPKVSHKSSEKSNYEINKVPSSDGKYQKTNSASKPLKESQQTESETKNSPSSNNLKKKELHGSRHKHNGKIITEKKKNEIKKEDVVDEKFDKKKNEKNYGCKQTNKEKALECIFGRKKENQALNESRKGCTENRPSAKLLEKLIEKTKKLSETLLSKS